MTHSNSTATATAERPRRPEHRVVHLSGPLAPQHVTTLRMATTDRRRSPRRPTTIRLEHAQINDRRTLRELGELVRAAELGEAEVEVVGLSPAAREVLRVDALIDDLRHRRDVATAS